MFYCSTKHIFGNDTCLIALNVTVCFVLSFYMTSLINMEFSIVHQGQYVPSIFLFNILNGTFLIYDYTLLVWFQLSKMCRHTAQIRPVQNVLNLFLLTNQVPSTVFHTVLLLQKWHKFTESNRYRYSLINTDINWM